MNENRKARIEEYGRGYEILSEAIKEFPIEMWQYRAGPDRWTIHEVIIHITDSETHSYARGRRTIAKSGSDVYDYPEELWAKKLNYHSLSTDTALELFRLLRQSSYELVMGLDDEAWTHTMNHSEIGAITLDEWMDTYINHVSAHVEQMQAIHADWKKETS